MLSKQLLDVAAPTSEGIRQPNEPKFNTRMVAALALLSAVCTLAATIRIGATAPGLTVPEDIDNLATIALPGLLGLVTAISAGILVTRMTPRQDDQQALSARARVWFERGAVFAILILAVIIRFYRLGDMPTGLWFDDAQNGIVAEHILHDPTYRPIFVPDITQLPALYLYLTAASIQLLGATAFALRAVGAVVGTVTVVAVWGSGRALFGPRAGFAAGAFAATSNWLIAFDRLALSSVVMPASAAVAAWCLAGAAPLSAKPADAVGTWSWRARCAGAAVAIAVGLYSYWGSYFAAPVAGLLLLIVASRVAGAAPLGPGASKYWGVAIEGALVLVVTLMLLMTPLIRYARAHPQEFSQRLGAASVFKGSPDETRKVLTFSAVQHGLMFWVHGDRNGRHHLPGAPMLDPLTGTLLVVGAAATIAGAETRARGVCLIAWIAIGLLAGILSVPFEAPQAHRTLIVAPAICLLSGAALSWLASAASVLFTRAAMPKLIPRVVRATVLVGGCIWVGAANVRLFLEQQGDPAAWASYSTDATLVANGVNMLPPNSIVYMPETVVGQPTVRFLAPQLKEQTPFMVNVLPLRQATTTAFFLDGQNPAPVDLLRTLYPHAAIQAIKAPAGGGTVLYQVVVMPDDIGAIQGATAVYRMPDSTTAPLERREPTIDTSVNRIPLSPPFEADWNATLVAPKFGDYGFQLDAPQGALFSIDRQRVTNGGPPIQITLARGNHEIEVKAQVDASQPVRLLWRLPSTTNLVPIPQQSLFTSPVTNNGLLGNYYANGTWTSPPAFEQIDPSVSFRYHLLPLTYPFSIEWTGQLAVPETGLYHFGTDSIDTSQLYIDGALVVDNTQATNAYKDAQLNLTAGLHDIRMRYEAHTGFNHVELYWQPPGRDRVVIPSKYLFPSRAVGEAQPLPELPSGASPQVPPASVLNAPTIQGTSMLQAAWRVDLGATVGKGSKPTGVALDNDSNIYVADSGRHTLIKLDTNGKLLWTAGNPAGQPPMQDVSSVAVAPDGTVFSLDSESDTIAHFSSDGRFLDASGGPSLSLFHPRSIAISKEGDFYIADTGGSRIVNLDGSGHPKRLFGFKGSGKGSLTEPTGVSVLPSGDILVVDATQAKIVRYAASGDVVTEWGFFKNETVAGPQLTWSPDGTIWASDTHGSRLLTFTVDGKPKGAYTGPAPWTDPSGLAAGRGYVIVTMPGAGVVMKLEMGTP